MQATVDDKAPSMPDIANQHTSDALADISDINLIDLETSIVNKEQAPTVSILNVTTTTVHMEVDSEEPIETQNTTSLTDSISELLETKDTVISDGVENDKNVTNQVGPTTIIKDNGIFEFMTPDRAIELYKRIHAYGPPELEWKFYGRRKPGDKERDDKNESNDERVESTNLGDRPQDQIANTEFDFDDEFNDLQTERPLVNESLQLKKRFEPGSEKKTNLSDIMSDIMKESHVENE